MSFRRILFWCHLSLGLMIGVVIAFLAVTGTLLSFQPQLVRLAERSVKAHAVQDQASCLSPGALASHAMQQAHAKAQSITLVSGGTSPALLTVNNDVVYLIDPCDGSLLQAQPSASRRFFSKAKDLHRWVAFGGSKHESLRAMKNAANLGFFVLMLLGLVLWVPRQWRAANIRSVILLRNNLRGRAREWNWHNVAGIWFALPLLIISLTGTIMAYSWASDALYRVAGSPAPKAAEEKQANGAPDFALLDALVPIAQAKDAAWQTMLIRMPKTGDKNASFTIDDALDTQPQHRNQLTLSRKGTVVRWEPFAALPKGRRWRLYVRFLHSGELFGVTGQTIAVLSALAALLLVWTGFSLSIRRALAWRTRTARAKQRAVATTHA